MQQSTTIHLPRPTPLTRQTTKNSALGTGRRPIIAEPIRATKTEFVDYVSLDRFRRETTHNEEESRRTWKAKFDPWFVEEHQKMYDSMAKNRGKPKNDRVIPLTRPEWQQPADILPPLYKRLSGQRRRRVLGSFPETENDKIGWRLLPHQALDIYGSKASNIPPLPKQYKLSNWPVESFS